MSDPKSDTWAYGLMICQLLRQSANKNSFDADNPAEIDKAFNNWITDGTKKSSEASIKIVEQFINNTPFEGNEELKDLVVGMMAYDPQNRPSDSKISEALEKIYNNQGKEPENNIEEPEY